MDIDIEDLLNNWYKAKQEIYILEQKCEKYKKVSEKLMERMDKNILNTSSYSLKKIDIVRNTISKNDIPSDIWNKYSKKNKYSSYYLQPTNKIKKSPIRKIKKSP